MSDRICLCGAGAGYPHSGDCPFPYYGNNQERIEHWQEERRTGFLIYITAVACEASETIGIPIAEHCADRVIARFDAGLSVDCAEFRTLKRHLSF